MVIESITFDIKNATKDGTINLNGYVVLPVSWLYYQSVCENLKVASESKLMETICGKLMLDIMISSREDHWIKELMETDLLFYNTVDKSFKFFNFGNHKVTFMVNGEKWMEVDFSKKLFRDEESNEVGFSGNGLEELRYNEMMLKLTGKFGVRLISYTPVNGDGALLQAIFR